MSTSLEYFISGIKNEKTKSVYLYQIEQFRDHFKIKDFDSLLTISPDEIKKKVEPEFTQSKDELGEYMKMLMSDSRKNNHTYNQNLVKMTFDPYLKDLKQSITDLNTKFEQKIDEDKPKKKMSCIYSKSSCSTL